MKYFANKFKRPTIGRKEKWSMAGLSKLKNEKPVKNENSDQKS